MKFTTLFEQTLAYWPSDLQVSDGHLIDNKKASFPSLNAAWEIAEEAAESQSEWQQLMVWAIYGGLHSHARGALESGIQSIDVKSIDLSYVERKFSENLFTKTKPGYPVEMKLAYINDLKP